MIHKYPIGTREERIVIMSKSETTELVKAQLLCKPDNWETLYPKLKALGYTSRGNGDLNYNCLYLPLGWKQHKEGHMDIEGLIRVSILTKNAPYDKFVIMIILDEPYKPAPPKPKVLEEYETAMRSLNHHIVSARDSFSGATQRDVRVARKRVRAARKRVRVARKRVRVARKRARSKYDDLPSHLKKDIPRLAELS